LGERAEYKGEFIDTNEEMDIWGATGGRVTAQAGVGAEYEITKNWSVYANVSGNYYEGGKGYYGNIGVNYSFGAGKKKELYEIKKDEGISQKPEMLSERDILNEWEVKGKKNMIIEADEETMKKTGLEKGKKFYIAKYGTRVFLFKNEEDMKKFKEREGEEKVKEGTEKVLKGKEIELKGYEKELGDTRDGMKIVQYAGGVNEIKALPEEVKAERWNKIIEKALEDNEDEDKDKRSAKEVVSDKEIVNIWKVKGERDGAADISKDAQKLGMIEGTKVYVMKYDDKILFFGDEKEAKRFKKKAEAEGKQAEIKETELRNGKVSFKVYEKELGDMREGMLIVQYGGGINEVKGIPEEVKRAQRNTVIESVLGNSNASMVWELKAENEVVKLDKQVLEKLGIKEGSKVYLLSYGSRVFLFENKADTQEFVKRLQEVGANIDEGDIREIDGLEVKGDKMELKAEEIKKIGDLSKGVRLEYYDKEKATEIKSIAQEQKKTKEAEITQEKLEGAKERREKEMIKKYKLNVATFKINDYKLSTKAKEAIAQQAKEIRKYDYNKITVEGHTDTSGSKEVNERISRQRAESVYNEFLLNGIPPAKITYTGYGSQVPIAPNTTKEGRAANRRTEIYVE
jgi:outer membrane protein OmpA-like peptidoglycan-associated protein